MLQQFRPKGSNHLRREGKTQSRKGPIRRSRREGRHRHPAGSRQATACKSRMAAVLEEEEGVDAIVQSKSIALWKIRSLIDIRGLKIFGFVVGQLTNGSIFVSVVVVRGGELTDG